VRVNMDSSIAADPRFKMIAEDLDTSLQEVIGCCYLLWLACYERRSECFTLREADIAAGRSGFSDMLIKHRLADKVEPHRLEIHGVSERISFLRKQAKSGRKGGKSSGKTRRDKSEARAEAPAEAPASGSAQAYTPTPAPDPTHTLSPTPALALSPSFDFESVYQHYPRKQGKQGGLKKCRTLIKTYEDFELFVSAVTAMEAAWKGHDTKYCPQFSTFVSQERWRDDVLPQPDLASSSKGLGSDDLSADDLWRMSQQGDA